MIVQFQGFPRQRCSLDASAWNAQLDALGVVHSEGAREINLAVRVGDRQLLKLCAGFFVAKGEGLGLAGGGCPHGGRQLLHSHVLTRVVDAGAIGDDELFAIGTEDEVSPVGAAAIACPHAHDVRVHITGAIGVIGGDRASTQAQRLVHLPSDTAFIRHPAAQHQQTHGDRQHPIFARATGHQPSPGVAHRDTPDRLRPKELHPLASKGIGEAGQQVTYRQRDEGPQTPPD